MALPAEPIIKKFFSNKIESTRDDWYGYLIRIARIFNSLDGAEYDRERLLESFTAMSGRQANADRDVANFRDEFGAYGTYLGIYHLENIGGKWIIVVSEAAKRFLCCANPNAAAFCRAQLALFQYPNGAGAVLNAYGTMNVQANSLSDTVREISNEIRLNPLRLVCRIVVSQVELHHRALSSIAIPYQVLFCMVNDDRINKTYNPSLEVINSVFTEYSAQGAAFTMNLDGLTNYKRNFHIFEKTGLFVRDSRFGLMVAQVNYDATYSCIKAISEMDTHFSAFDEQYESPDENSIKGIISGPAWGQYYDAAALPPALLEALGVELDHETESRAPHDENTGLLTPEWFNTHGQAYLHLDAEAAVVREQFLSKYGPEQIAELSGIDLLRTIFLNDVNKENLCYSLEFDGDMRELFGSIKSGTAYKYGLFYSKKHNSWVSGSGKNPHVMSVEEAIEYGTQIRDYLFDGATIISSAEVPDTLDGYRALYAELNEATGGFINRVWFMKYYHMLAPNLFPPIYSWSAQSTVLNAIGQEPDDNAVVRMGQLATFIAKCDVSPVVFSRTFWSDYNGDGGIANGGDEPVKPIKYKTGYQTRFSRNRIIFGAPGTGKSFTLNKEKDDLLENGGVSERVTFHPDYSYANFVGTYKPVPVTDESGNSVITYRFVPGPFMRVYVAALKNSREEVIQPHILLIEEINRANVAAVFGDVFQLLDRGDDGVSEYPICASEDIKAFLAEELEGEPSDFTDISLPDNMFIWATMNSADQGVFPMDTAFKRRWDFTYIGINASEAKIAGKTVILGTGENERVVEWNELRKAINDRLSTFKINEDKLLGPYFLSRKIVPDNAEIDRSRFVDAFKNKVLMYLFDDAAKQKRPSLFADGVDTTKYSAVCKAFEVDGVFAFCSEISSKFTTIPNHAEGEGDPQ